METTASAPTTGNISISSASSASNRLEGPQRTHWVGQRSRMREGDARADKPRFGATCQVVVSALRCLQDSQVTQEQLTGDFFYSKYLNRNHSGEVQVGNADTEVDKALELCVRTMRPGETARVVLGAQIDLWRNGRRGEEDEKVVLAELECEVTLESVLNAQSIHKWYPETKFDKAQEANAAAIRLFKLKRTVDAFHKFHLALTLLTFVLQEDEEARRNREKETSSTSSTSPGVSSRSSARPVPEEIMRQAKEMALTCQSNLAACHFQWGNHAFVARLATKVLEKQPANVKMLYRRGVAYLEMKDFDASRRDLVEAHRLDSSNKAINDKMGVLRLQEKKQREQLAGGMKKMFS